MLKMLSSAIAVTRRSVLNQRLRTIDKQHIQNGRSESDHRSSIWAGNIILQIKIRWKHRSIVTLDADVATY
jgi:hypothetical protein